MSDLLLPAENMALTVARAQTQRGEAATPNIAAVLVLALDRLIEQFGDEPLYRFIEDKASSRRVERKCTTGTCPHDMWSDHRCMERVWPKEAADD